MVLAFALLLSLSFLGAAGVMVWSQTRYLSRYRAIHGVDPLQSDRIGPAPWLFFGLFPRIMHDLFAAYSTVQTLPELERLRRRVERWKRIAFGAWALLMLLSIVRLAGLV